MKKKNTTIRQEARQCYGDLLNYTKFNLTLNHHDAEDLVSETYIKFFNSYDKGRSNYKEGTNILGYLKLIVKNLYIDRIRKQKRSPNIISIHKNTNDGEIVNFNEYKSQKLEKDEESIKDPFALNLDIAKVLKKMDSLLSREDKEIFFLVFIEGYKYNEVAKKLKISQGTIGSRLNRNLKKIRQELDKKNVVKIKEIKK
jgi:RNA polymerase sigma-70 factor (ECF subfamily)